LVLLAIAIMKFIFYFFLDLVDYFIHECHLDAFNLGEERIEIRSF
jgi:hypothetical protein